MDDGCEHQNQALEPEHLLAALASQENGFIPPVTVIDGAARVCDPFLSYLYSDKKRLPKYGLFLKDYHKIKW